MLNEKKQKIIIDHFQSIFKTWMESYEDVKLQKAIDAKWTKEVENKYTDKEIIQATFWKITELCSIERAEGEKLIKASKDLLILLLTQYHFNEDLFKDFKININATYKTSHLRKIK